MKIFSRLLSFYQKNYLPILTITILFFFTWRKVLNQVFIGEGYIYFDHVHDFFIKGWFIDFWKFNISCNFARFFFDVVPPILRDNLTAYLLLSLIIGLVFSLSFYIVLKKITKSNMIAFTATIFLSINYVAMVEFLASGQYQRFVQRFPNLIPDIFSFFFLWKYLKEKKPINYLVSIFLFALSLAMGSFSSLTLPIFAIYPLFQIFEEKINWKSLIKNLLISTSFILIAYLLTKNNDTRPEYSLLNYLINENNLIEKIFYQIPMITVPINLIPFIAKNLPHPVLYPYIPLLRFFLIPCLIFYFGGIPIVAKKLPKLTFLYISFLLSMIATMLLFMSVDNRLDVMKNYGEDRYYLVSSMFAVVCWAILIKAIFIKSFNKNQIRYFLASLFILSAFCLNNIILIQKHIDLDQPQSEIMKNVINYLNYISPQFSDKTIIIVPFYIQYPLPLITGVGKYPNIKVYLNSDGWEKKFWSERDNVFVFDYDFEYGISKDSKQSLGKVLNLTQKYRNGEKITFYLEK